MVRECFYFAEGLLVLLYFNREVQGLVWERRGASFLKLH